MQTRLSIISNILFKYFIIFAISFLWLNSYFNNIIIVIIISLTLSIIIGKIVSIIRQKKLNNTQSYLKEQEHIKNISFQLLLTNHDKIVNFYSILLNAKHNVIKLNDNKGISWDDCVFIPLYTSKTVNIDMVAEIYRLYHNFKTIIIAGIDFTDEATKLAEKVDETKLVLLNENLTYKLFKKYDFYPDFKIKIIEKEKFKLKHLKNIALKKSNTKQYLYSAIIILITSLFIEYSIFYLIFASLLFMLAGICRLKPQKEPPSIFDKL